MNKLSLLAMAADYLEQQEREIEHGYACSRPPQRRDRLTKSSSSSSSSTSSSCSLYKRKRLKRTHSTGNGSGIVEHRSSHNELEKNRRAHMRNCFEQLKKVVPLDNETTRHTTQGLLTKACRLITSLETEVRDNMKLLEQLKRVQVDLHQVAVPRQLNVSRRPCDSAIDMDFIPGSSYVPELCSISNSSLSSTCGTDMIELSSLHDAAAMKRRVSRAMEVRAESSGSGGRGAVKRRETISCSSSSDDVDDAGSQASIDSGCGLSPCSKFILDGL